MPLIISISLAILIWSLYPLAVSFALKDMDEWDFMLSIITVCFVCSIIVGAIYLFKEKKFKQIIEIQKNLPKQAYFMGIIAGVSGMLCHTFFIWALSLAHKGGVSLIFKSWPIIAVIATPFIMKKVWKNVSLKDFMICLLALCGVAMIILSDKNIDIDVMGNSIGGSWDYKVFVGYILAFVGGYMVAIGSVTQAALVEYYSDLKDDFGAALVTQVFHRGVSLIVAIIFFYFFKDANIAFSITWPPVIFVGLFVLIFGASLYTYSILKSDSPTIHIMYYFVPVLAVLWLWIAGESTINIWILFGGALIVASNIYLTVASRKSSNDD